MAEFEDSLDYEEEHYSQSASCAFSDAELRALLMAYIDNIDLFERRHCPAVTEGKKAAAWQKLCAAVNACGQGSLRTIKSLKKKISDMKSSAKTWLRFQKNPPTGNRKGRKKLWYYDTIIDHVIGRDSPILDGVQDCSNAFMMMEEKVVDLTMDGAAHQRTRTVAKTESAPEDIPGFDIIPDEKGILRLAGSFPDTSKTSSRHNVPTHHVSTPLVAVEVPGHSRAGNDSFCTENDTRFFKRPMCSTPRPSRPHPVTNSTGQPNHSLSFKRKAAEHQQHGSTQQPHHLKNKRKQNYDQLLELEIEKTKSQLECLAKETEGRKENQESNVVAQREMISLQRERLQLKKLKLEMQTERSLQKVKIEREKAKLKLEQLQIQKAELEVVQLQHAVNGFK